MENNKEFTPYDVELLKEKMLEFNSACCEMGATCYVVFTHEDDASIHASLNASKKNIAAFLSSLFSDFDEDEVNFLLHNISFLSKRIRNARKNG